MKKMLISLFFLCGISGFAYSQDTITVFYDTNWVEISNKNDAVFYRKAFENSTHEWIAHDYYISNNIQMTGAYTSKKLVTKQGHFTYFFENGKKASEGNYIDDKRDGLWSFWQEEGQKKSEGTFSKDDKVGIWNYWYPNGQLQFTENYQKGKSCTYAGFYQNGFKRLTGSTVNGLPKGTWMYWNSDGRPTLSGNFVNGLKNGDWIRTFRDGKMILPFKNGILENKQLGGIIRNE